MPATTAISRRPTPGAPITIHYVVVDGDNDTAAADLTINVTAPPPTYALTGAPDVTEGGDLVFHLDLSHANATDTVFTIGTQNGTATGGADFETSNFEYSTNGGQAGSTQAEPTMIRSRSPLVRPPYSFASIRPTTTSTSRTTRA